jgi:hypothetical protein
MRFKFGADSYNCVYSLNAPEIHLVLKHSPVEFWESSGMFTGNGFWIFLLSEMLKRGKLRVIPASKSWDILKVALFVVVCAAVPIKTAAAQSISAERGYQNVMKPADIKKKIIKNKNVTSAKFVKPIYLGGAPYICTPSGFGHTSKCFFR